MADIAKATLLTHRVISSPSIDALRKVYLMTSSAIASAPGSEFAVSTVWTTITYVAVLHMQQNLAHVNVVLGGTAFEDQSTGILWINCRLNHVPDVIIAKFDIVVPQQNHDSI